MAYVYRHLRLDTNQPFYIGIGIQPWRATVKRGRSLDWKKIVAVTDYEVEVIMDDIPIDVAAAKEMEFITMYGMVCNGTGTLVNRTKGGELGVIKKGYVPWNIGIETGKRPTGLPSWNKGLKTGKPAYNRGIPSKNLMKPIFLLDGDGHIIKEYSGCREAAKDLNLNDGSVSRVANGIYKSTKGHHFSYKCNNNG